MKTPQTENFWVIGVGASAGGLEALTSFVRSIPEKPPAAFIVAQHLAPHAKSMMVELLNRHSSLPVVAAENHLELKAGLICIVPPNHDVVVENGELRLSVAGNETRPKPSVDVLFKSLAEVYGRRAVGIILSGTGTDGSEGIRAIKENSGFTFVQDSLTAKYDGMPKSAFDTGLVDAVLPPEKIGSDLFKLLKEKKDPQPQASDHTYDDSEFKNLLAYLKSEVGTDFTRYKESTLRRRLQKRLAQLHIKELSDYTKLIKGNAEELSSLAHEMLVSVTNFYRDPEAFSELEKRLEEIISQKKSSEDLRIWVAGCATGEESYTFAMIVSELLSRLGKSLPVKIFATDLDHEALAQARTGIYSAVEMTGLSQELIDKYFIQHDSSWEAKKTLRDLIVFAKQDLTLNPPFVKLDLVSCRNVLIYFDNILQNRVFETFHYSLKAGGVLFLGKSESANQSLFEVIDRKNKIFRRVPGVSHYSTHRDGRPAIQPASTSPRRPTSPESKIGDATFLAMLKVLGTCGVVIDESGSVLHSLGDLSSFLAVPSGSPDFRLHNLLQKNMAVEFSVLLKKCAKDKKTYKSRSYKSDKSAKKNISFSVSPLEPGKESPHNLFLVVFEKVKIAEVQVDHLAKDVLPARMLELEQEVAATKENLQTVIEELEISNEELQSLNEELSSTNEELQASNEELETTNEEMQSTNEELTTLNEELSVKSTELRFANASLENIQTSISSPLIVIDNDLNIQRYNQSSNQVFTLSYADIGNSIINASCQCEIPDFEKNLRHTIKTGEISEVICTANKKVFQLRITPNRDESKAIIGAIIVFFDNTEFIRSQEKLQASDRRIRSIINNSQSMISLKDNVGKYLLANEAFFKYFKLNEADVLGKTDREIFPDQLALQLRDNDLEVLLRREPTQKQEELVFRDKRVTFLTNRFALYGVTDRNPYAVGSVSLDITEQMRAQAELSESEARYKAIIEDQAVFICRHLPNGKITFTNTAFSKFFDKSSASNFIDIVEPEDRARVEGELKNLSYQHPIIQYEHRHLRAFTKDPQWIRWIHRGLFNKQNELIEFQAVGFDVTEIHNLTSDLLAKENLFTHVLEHTSDYLSVYRVEGTELVLESFNQSAAKNRGFNNPRLLGHTLKELIEPSYYETIRPHYERAIRTESIQTFEESFTGPGGARTLATTLVPVRDKFQGFLKIVVINRDVTNIKRIERALREEKLNAEKANSAKTDFLASMSHELRTPLNVIMGMTQLLERSSVRPEQTKYIESITRSSKVLLALIEDVLDLSKIEAGRIELTPSPISVNQICEDVLSSFDGLAQNKHLELVKILPRDDLRVSADSTRLKQVLINLLGNALKFTEKGSITLETSVKVIQSTAHYYFKIVDTGIGIPADSFPKIFQRFSQADSGTSRKYGGTGLGLAICKQLVKLMGGDIGFESDYGSGTTFWFSLSLPIVSQDVKPKVVIEAGNLSHLRVLAVDDNAESLNMLRMLLEDDGMNVTTVTSGRECLSVLAAEEFDVVLMDMQMPEMDGLETTREIRKLPNHKSTIPVIALTANAMAADKELCLKAGMNDFLTKPVNFNQLRLSLEKFAAKDS